MKHLIARQKLKVQLASQSGAFALQQELSDWYWHRLVPAMERLFDRLAGPDSLIRLDKIELEIHVDNLDQLRTEAFLNAVLLQLQKAIEEPVQLHTSPVVSQMPWTKGMFDLWLYFLEHGMLPASAALPPSDAEWHRCILDTLATERPAVDRFLNLIQQKTLALERLVLQHKTQFLHNLALITLDSEQRALAKKWLKNEQPETGNSNLPEKESTPADNAGFLRQEAKSFAARLLARLNLLLKSVQTEQDNTLIVRCLQTLEQTILTAWESQTSLQDALRKPGVWQNIWKKPELSGYLQTWWQIIGETSPHLIPESDSVSATAYKKARQGQKLQAEQFKSFAPFRSQKQFWAVFATFLLEDEESAVIENSSEKGRKSLSEIDSSAAKNPVAPDSKQISGKHEIADWRAIFKQQKDPIRPAPVPLPETPPNAQEGFYLNNAGLVLLHPFLSTLFKKLELVGGVDFETPASRQRAVCILHFLATGQSQTPEYQLILPKFLCGIPFNVPLDHTIRLTTTETDEAENMLQAAIEHWSALGSTSPDGLREGFLQREGKLSKTDAGWILEVERKTLDILLNSLPWGISMVKFPWMPEPLRVQWH